MKSIDVKPCVGKSETMKLPEIPLFRYTPDLKAELEKQNPDLFSPVSS